MHITDDLDHSIRALTFLAMLPSGGRATTAALAEAVDCKPWTLRPLLQRLVDAQILHSYRGFEGGFALARPAERISLLDVELSLEDRGPSRLNEFQTEESPYSWTVWCAQREVWARAKAAANGVLRNETLDELAASERACRLFQTTSA